MREPAAMCGPPASAAREATARATIAALVLAGLVSAWILTRPEPFALGGDNLTLTYALLAEAARRLAGGELPLWTESRWGGSPLAGDPVVGALYPGHLVGFLVTPFPHERALDADVALHLVWLALGMVFWLRGLGIGPLAALAGLVLLTINPTIAVAARSWVQYWAALAWWPWLLGAATRAATSRSRWPGALAAVALAAQVYAGYPEFALHSGVAALLWVALGVGSRGGIGPGAQSGARSEGDGSSRARRVATALWIGLAAVALAAPQILPGIAMARDSIRTGAEGEVLRAWMGRFALSAVGWREAFGPRPVSDLLPFRLAPALVPLAFLGALRGDGRARFVAGVAVASALLASGVFHGALAALPVLRFFPAPAKLVYLLVFATVSLAAVGIDRAGSLPAPVRRMLLLLLVGSAVPALYALAPRLWWVVAAIGMLGALVPARMLDAALTAGALAASLATFAATDPLHAKHFFAPGRFEALLERPLPERFGERPMARSLALEDAGDRRTVRQVGLDYAGLFGQPSWNGIGPLAQRRQIGVMERVAPGRAGAVARAIGASPLVVAEGGALAAELEAEGFAGPPPEDGLQVLFAPEVRPRYELLTDVRFVPAAEAMRAAREGAAIGPDAALIEAHDGGAPTAAESAPTGDGAGRIEVIAARRGFAELAVDVDRPTWLLAREPYYRGWRATVDANEVEVRPAGGFLIAFEVPAGRHAVRLEYVEGGFAIGGAAAALALVASALAFARGRTRSGQARRGRK
jgi:Bacterial membrane protein YfhO